MEETSLSDFVGDDERGAGSSEGEDDGGEGDVVVDDSGGGSVGTRDEGGGDVDKPDAGGDVSDGGETSAGAPGSATSPTDEAAEMPAEPAVTATYRPAGGTCGRCEASVGWLWTDGDERVCRGCKDW